MADANSPIIGAQAVPAMPSAEQMKAMEAKACQFADALMAEGRTLDVPDKQMAVKMLAFIALGKVIARLATEERLTPEQAERLASGGAAQATRLAMRQEIVAAGRKLVAGLGAKP